MEMIKRFPMRNILIFGIVAAALRLILALYNPMQMLYQSGSLAGPALLALVTIVPLTLFFWVFWLRVTMPRIIWAGSLTAGIGGICAFLFRIGFWSAIQKIYRGMGGFVQGTTMWSALMILSDLAVFVGILLIGFAFMKNPQKKNSLGGLLALIGGCAGGLQMVLALSGSFMMNYLGIAQIFNTLQTLLGVAAWALVIAFMILLFLGQPAPAPRPRAPGSSPYDNIPHY